MSIEVTVRHMSEVGDIQQFARDKGEELVSDFKKVEHVHVILDNGKHHQYQAEVVVQGKNLDRVLAQEVSDNMRTAINAAFAKVEKQLRRFREKVTDHRSKSTRSPEPVE